MSTKDDAARAGPERPVPEDYVAERIKQEREARGWSTVALAEKMAEVGHSLNQAAIWRIESGKPRRRVNLDEALGFCKVFGLTMDELTAPPLKHADLVIRGIVRECIENKAALARAKSDVEFLERQIDRLEFELKHFASYGDEQKAELEQLIRLEEEAWKRQHP
ncbi:helix-turn-helix domain-containing protein [Streptomyces sp. NBC_01433]|uniref:helix-turn-helix transcriptional regulator n=1 Tax=Streptomyces sp. NBC_01433 TaxID=2903864 RepID=UPI00224FFD89|nr:helix-turn-helix transcriptional regulator [Streptomyces sp. NBC_01433]MCX4675559.1 helix-turn-helix domain-containing protein [Streptomyces sp. NBC_01433]